MIARRAPPAPVLLVIADPTIRQLVGWIIQEMTLIAMLTPTWREAIVATTGPPSCIVPHLDDIGDKSAGVSVLRKSWGSVPLIVRSRRQDIGEQAAALVGIRKPMNVRALMEAIRRATT